ncbi:WYL domain-containing protein [Burkholderia pyrrocinia]|uniref:helix-turn-helix transcriptional regulator n=1 Tax=Burkholderia pyrrocinia TaxID=60550 RepID=UPI002AB2E602|nr:WYL domain-containing protein [Burkholderia pyrrocinia]
MQDASPICAAFPDLSAPEPKIFAALSQAIRLGLSVELTYRSMNQPQPHQRIIAPHHLIRAGRRWHIRAYCTTHQTFRDYALGRIVGTSILPQASEHRAEDDAAWNAIVPVRLIAHPELNHTQQDVIRFEYFSGTAARIVTCRGALAGYFVQDVRAATDIKTQRPPDYQLAVENLDEISPWLFPF